MPALTPNYDFNLPLVGSATDEDLWGNLLNTNFTELDSFLFTATNDVTRAVSGTDTATGDDRNKVLLCDATSAAFNETLPAPSVVASGFTITIKKIDSSAHAVTILPNASEKIDGAASYALSTQYQVSRLTTDGTNWFVAATLGISANSPAFTGTPTAPTAAPLTNNTQLATTAYADLAVAAKIKKFVSTQQTITAAGTLLIPHGLGAIPDTISFYLVNQTGEGGFSPSDRYYYGAGSQIAAGGGTMLGVDFSPDTTNLNALYGNAAQVFEIKNKSTRAAFAITPANWKMVAVAEVIS